MLEQRDHCRVELGEKVGDAVTLRQEITLRVGRSDGNIGGLVDDRAHTGPDHRVEHLFAERDDGVLDDLDTSEEHTSELKSLMRISYAVFCLTKNTPRHRSVLQAKDK